MSDETKIINSIKKNLYFQISYFQPHVPGMRIFMNGAAIKLTDISDDTFNLVINSCFTSQNIHKKIDETIRIFKNKNLPFSWWVGPKDSPDNLKEILIKKGFKFKENSYGMYIDLKALQLKPLVKLKIKQVLNVKELKEFDDAHVKSFRNSKAFDVIFSKIPESAYGKKAPFRFYVGYFNEKAVTTGVLVFHANVAGIYFIVTLPEERNRGYATEMMHFLLDRAKKENQAIAILQATEKGKNLYEKIGFKYCCLFEGFALEK